MNPALGVSCKKRKSIPIFVFMKIFSMSSSWDSIVCISHLSHIELFLFFQVNDYIMVCYHMLNVLHGPLAKSELFKGCQSKNSTRLI